MLRTCRSFPRTSENSTSNFADVVCLGLYLRASAHRPPHSATAINRLGGTTHLDRAARLEYRSEERDPDHVPRIPPRQ